MNRTNATVFVVDDDANVRRVISRLIRSAGYEVETFRSAEDYLQREHFDGLGCMVLDVRLPGEDGLELQERLTGADYSMPIIFISGYGDIPMSVETIKKGAVDFLPKPFDYGVLLAAIKAAIEKDSLERAEYNEAAEYRKLIQTLTPREYEVFTYVITGMLNKQIGAKLGVTEKTIKVHRSRVMAKLHVVSVAELVRIAEKVGITPAG